MPFPAGWPPPLIPGQGPNIRFFVSGTATAAFSDTTYLFAQQPQAVPAFSPFPTVHARYVPPNGTLPVPIAPASVAAIHAAVQESAANAFPGPFAVPDVPRNLTVTFAAGWQGGNVSIGGTGALGQPMGEVFAAVPGATVVGKKIFQTVTQASKTTAAGTTDTASIGTGEESVFFAHVPPLSAGTFDPISALYSCTIRICNDADSGGSSLEFSFDGVNVHGLVRAGEQVVYRQRREAGISLRGGVAFRCEAW